MSEPLGRVERPTAESFESRRKLYLVFLVFTHESAPPEYNERCERYWAQVREQLVRIESKAGPSAHIYHESVYAQGDEGLSLVQKMNHFTHELAASRCAGGAVLEAVEDRELAAEVSDWERFMMMGCASSKVGELVRDLYTQALKNRNEHVIATIDGTLGRGEAGLIFVGEGHRLQFPSDIEVFSVVPPALDELHRWLRDQAGRLSLEDEGKAEAEGEEGEQEVTVESGAEEV
jgi:hypothetical protein